MPWGTRSRLFRRGSVRLSNPAGIQELEVFKAREAVGKLSRTPGGCLFRYHPAYVQSGAKGIAQHLPCTGQDIEVRGATNLPTYFAGLLPEGVLLDAMVRSRRVSRDDLFGILAETAFDAIGDITVLQLGKEMPNGYSSVAEVKVALDQILMGAPSDRIAAISGVQPKLSIGNLVGAMRGKSAIVKIEPAQYPGILKNEAYFMKLAKAAGLTAAEVILEEDALVVTRFDRVRVGRQPSKQLHIEDALQLLDRYPFAKYSLDYFEILAALRQLGSSKAVLLDLFRLYFYSYVIGNGDLHAKNVSFVYNEIAQQWVMSPAYDLLCTLPYEEEHRMALPLDEQYGQFTRDDFVKAGLAFGVTPKAMESMMNRVVGGVLHGMAAAPPPVQPAIQDMIQRRAESLA